MAIATFIETASNYIKTHERLIIVVLCLGLIGWGADRALNIYEGYEQGRVNGLQQQLDSTKQQATAASQSAQDAKAAAQATATEAAQDKAASAAIITTLTQQNASLANQIAQRNTQTQQQQKVDLTATLPELGERFKALVPNINPADVKMAADGTSVTIGQDTAQKAVAQLEQVPTLTADNKDLTQQVQNGQQMLASSQKALDSQTALSNAQQNVINAQDKYTTLLQTEISQANAVCQAQINVEKANTKKAFVKGFKWGTVFGFIGGLFVGHSL